MTVEVPRAPRRRQRAGTVLAVADAMGFSAIGVERSAKRCKAARTLVIEPR